MAFPAIIGAIAQALTNNNNNKQPQPTYDYGHAVEGAKTNTPENTSAESNQKTTNNPKAEEGTSKSGSDFTGKIEAVMDGISSVIGAMPKGGTAQPVQVGNYGSPAVSDERLKNKEKLAKLFGDDDSAIDAFSKIDAYVYNYTPEAQELYKKGDRGVDDNTHFGPMAQDLAKNPVTSGTVHKDENGYMMVDIRQLALTNTAMISQLARKVEELEEKLGGR